MPRVLALITPVPPPSPPDADPAKPPSTGVVSEPFVAVIQTLEPPGPVDPGWGHRPPVDPGYGIPEWPGLTPGGPRPDHELPGAPGHPGNRPPGSGFPHPAHPIYHPDKPTPQPPPGGGEHPPEVWPPPDKPQAPGYIFVWIPGVGYRWVRVGGPPNTKPEPPGGTKPVEPAAPKH